jgi:hypothetical protein
VAPGRDFWAANAKKKCSIFELLVILFFELISFHQFPCTAQIWANQFQQNQFKKFQHATLFVLWWLKNPTLQSKIHPLMTCPDYVNINMLSKIVKLF